MIGMSDPGVKSMTLNIAKVLMALIVVFTILIVFSNNVVADVPPSDFPNPPGSIPSGGGGSSSGGGGSGGGGYTPAQFEKYTEPLKSSDGTVIGHIDAENFNSYIVWAERNGTIGNITYDLTVEGELSSMPDNYWLDIDFLGPVFAALPPGMENSLVFAVLNVTKNPDGWSWKSGNPKYTLKISGSPLNPGDTYYIVRSSTSDYQMQKVNVGVSASEATIKFNPAGDTGIFSLMLPVLPTPTPTPTPTPVPTPTPTPLPENNIWSYPIFIAIFTVGAIAGAATLFIVTRGK